MRKGITALILILFIIMALMPYPVDAKQSIQDTLGDRYSYVIRDNGEIIIEEAKGYAKFSIYIPSSYQDQKTNLIIYFNGGYENGTLNLGAADYRGDALSNRPLYWQEDMINALIESCPNTIIAVAKSSYEQNFMKYIDPIISELKIDIGKTIIIGWSDGGYGAMNTAYDMLSSYKDYNTPLLVLCDCNHTSDISDIQYETIQQYMVPVVVVTGQQNDLIKNKRLYSFRNYDIPIWYICDTIDRSNMNCSAHMTYRENTLRDGIINFLFNNTQTINQVSNSLYNFGKWNYFTGSAFWFEDGKAFLRDIDF